MFNYTLVDNSQRETALRLPVKLGSGSQYPKADIPAFLPKVSPTFRSRSAPSAGSVGGGRSTGQQPNSQRRGKDGLARAPTDAIKATRRRKAALLDGEEIDREAARPILLTLTHDVCY